MKRFKKIISILTATAVMLAMIPAGVAFAASSVSITPSTEHPTASVTVKAGESFTINVTNGSTHSAYDFTSTSGDASVAKVSANATVNIGTEATKAVTVDALKAGTATITIANENSYGSQYQRVGTVTVTVLTKDGKTPASTTDTKLPVIAPKHDNPPVANATVSVGSTLTVQIKNETEHDNSWAFSGTSSNSGVAAVEGSTGTLGPNETGTIKIKGVKAGTAVVTIKNDNDNADYIRTATINVTVVKNDKKEKVSAVNAKTVTYDGKKHTGTVYFKDSKGNVVKSQKITKTVPGTYKTTYNGVTGTFKIAVKTTSIKSLKKAKKAFTVKVAKQGKAQVTGYQVRYSTSKSGLSKASVKTLSSKYSTTSKKIKKLKAKKTYYVQVRSYKKIGAKKYYSAWSTAKSVKTK